MKLFLSYFMFFFVFTITAQKNIEEEAIREVIATFFKGLHKGDSAVVSKTFHKDIKIQTTTTQKGKKILVTEAKTKLLTGIAAKDPKHVYFEKLLAINVQIDGNLASVWTPYEFYFNGTFSHCGANSFQLFNNNGLWQITYLIDMRRRTNCKALQNQK
ncbi:MAG: nuclear transport factor 2 family protein [Polaribacter sp.]|jgi:hypothetical protein|nr:nuclear transport factor 2 family protein [Polaribacter sp.]MDG1246673.1 nuclear transport factor 2 family protein [Polaribacter sp.]MDG1321222.1 nuclear transport factor 2 family protein [Polaribacter sp.]